ncbi:hypothetical protein SAMD00019534_061450 [Acytostelium subglobosum LB1]|uniref:hypothetical protein n=1 Tax=Acytostelium subglobosum LB1 TaxID=1410327 RepID=UPI000644ABD7|nr:hypothetical protein SAMD00019534_061450 [Acytostelium subglobosum LB1]GAM22970.1 hypothetical protein SAMD00019534_061450 [Acytostelium subglobosum LB1]|eukprot:XP_012754197.1 hypothetical protein SAMD00019534_061450 [Acytostelium subglobosum LB1]
MFVDSFNQTITPGCLPQTIHTLKFGKDFNKPIIPGSLPESLVDLTFGDDFNQSLQWPPPPSSPAPTAASGLSTLLSFGVKRSSSPAPASVPSPSLPPSIIRLKFGSSYNMPVEACDDRGNVTGTLLPQSLNQLHFGTGFVQPLPANSLPMSLEVLRFQIWFTQPCMAAVTQLQSLKVLLFSSLPINDRHPSRPYHRGDDDAAAERHTFPSSLISLYISHNDFSDLPNSLPDRLRTLSLGKTFCRPLALGSLPSSITSLELGHAFRQWIEPGILPASLTELSLRGLSQEQEENVVRGLSLPGSITSLYLSSFNLPIKHGELPAKLQKLYFGNNYDHSIIPGILPQSITSIIFGNCYNKPITPGTLPQSLKSLRFCEMFDQVIEPGALPDSLESLEFGAHFNQVIRPGVLPPNLTMLILGSEFRQPFTPATFPPSLTIFKCSMRRLSSERLPKSITRLYMDGTLIHRSPQHLPNLKHLKVSIYNFKKKEDICDDIIVDSVDIRYLQFPIKELKHLRVTKHVSTLYLGQFSSTTVVMDNHYLSKMVTQGRVRTKTVKRASKLLIEKYYPKLTNDFDTNKRTCDEVATIASKRLRNKIAGFVTHLMRRIERGPVRGISYKLQEEERERRDNYVPTTSAIKTDKIYVDEDAYEMLKSTLGNFPSMTQVVVERSNKKSNRGGDRPHRGGFKKRAAPAK